MPRNPPLAPGAPHGRPASVAARAALAGCAPHGAEGPRHPTLETAQQEGERRRAACARRAAASKVAKTKMSWKWAQGRKDPGVGAVNIRVLQSSTLRTTQAGRRRRGSESDRAAQSRPQSSAAVAAPVPAAPCVGRDLGRSALGEAWRTLLRPLRWRAATTHATRAPRGRRMPSRAPAALQGTPTHAP